jgi:hypothetical protein
MGITRPTGGYAEEMLDPGGWPEVDEDTFYDRAQEFTQVLRQVTEVLETCQQQQGQIFDGGIWSGGAAEAANGELGTNIGELMTLQNGLATVITWHSYIAESIVQAKSNISDNVVGAHKQINALENDSSLDAAERNAAIYTVVGATHGANVSVVAGTAEQILATKAWKPPNNALRDLLDQKTPPSETSLAGEAPAGVLANQVGQLGLTGDGESAGDDSPDEPTDSPAEPTEPDTPAAPGFTMPDLSQISQLSQQASQHMNLVNQAMGQVQQVASSAQQGAQQGPEAAAPAEEDVLADDVEGVETGAAAGAAGPERAPIEVATVGAEQPQGATPAERIL